EWTVPGSNRPRPCLEGVAVVAPATPPVEQRRRPSDRGAGVLSCGGSGGLRLRGAPGLAIGQPLVDFVEIPGRNVGAQLEALREVAVALTQPDGVLRHAGVFGEFW